MYYIQETDKPSFIHKKLNIVKIDNDKIILPINEEKISDKKAKQNVQINKTKEEKSKKEEKTVKTEKTEDAKEAGQEEKTKEETKN